MQPIENGGWVGLPGYDENPICFNDIRTSGEDILSYWCKI